MNSSDYEDKALRDDIAKELFVEMMKAHGDDGVRVEMLAQGALDDADTFMRVRSKRESERGHE